MPVYKVDLEIVRGLTLTVEAESAQQAEDAVVEANAADFLRDNCGWGYEEHVSSSSANSEKPNYMIEDGELVPWVEAEDDDGKVEG